MFQCRTTCRRAAGRAIWAWCVVALTIAAVFGSAPASAQQRKPNAKSEAAAPPAAPKPTGRIVDRDMFDRITLDASNNNAVIEVQALDLPNRRVPANPKPDDKLVVRLIGRPSQLFELSWRNIAKIELYEDLLVAEATKLVGLKRYEEAFEYLDAVYRRDPKYPELREAVQYLLYVNAGSYFGQKRYPEALSLLEELYRLNPNYKHPGQNATVGEAISRLIDQIMTRYMAAQDYGMARNMLVRVTSSYGEKQQATVDKWRAELVKLAEAQRDKARQLIDEQKMREALAATNEMLRIWPEVKGAAELDREMADRYPIVLIGVQQAVGGHPDRMDAWASRRISRLGQRKLSEFVGKGPEGGRYESPLGTFESSDDGKQVTLTMRSSTDGNTIPISGYDVARRLIELADPSSKAYSPAWGGLMASVSVDDVTQVKIDLRRPHVLPQSLLQITLPLPAGGGGVALGPYAKGPTSPAETSYMVNRQYQFYQSKQPKELVEKIYERSDKAITALKRGDIDMLDRVFPADVFRLKNDSSLTVGQ
ncbi:MAG TPA: hypothetical protein PLV92_08660, partial [Pirellulaceae bacterium]|nr:hypothetical protein [Pirellulaceae bacterium]